MKKNELKKVLKPLIKECIKECIFEEGVLSGIIAEVAHGINSNAMVVEGKVAATTKETRELQETAELAEQQRQERIKRLNESTSLGTMNVFEGTQEIIPEGNQHGALSGVPPGDSGVDIGGIMNLAGGKWKHLIR